VVEEDESLFSRMPKITRAHPDREKPAKRGRKNKSASRAKDGKNPAVQATGDVVNENVLSELLSKFGIEEKIDKIEAEIDAERKVRAVLSRLKEENPTEHPALSEPGTAAAEKHDEEAVVKPHVPHVDHYGRVIHPPAHLGWKIGAVALGVLLLAQLTLLLRHGVSRAIPSTRPALVSLCKVFGCSMPLPRDRANIVIGEDLGMDCMKKAQTGYCTVYAQIINRAGYAQDWPYLEITLRNKIKQPIARRVIQPEEWVPPNLPTEGGIPPLTTVDVNLDLDVGVDSAGFNLQGFYP